MPSATTSGSSIELHAITDVGRYRSHNEDNFIACPDLREKQWVLPDQPVSLSPKGCVMVVADGMGGTNAGEVASQIAVDSIRGKFNDLERENGFDDQQVRDFLNKVILGAHEAIVESSIRNPEFSGMGTTIIVAWVFPDKVHLGWCGDSRAYLYRKKEGLKLLSRDHSLVWEWVEDGKITPEEADVHPRNNIITQSLGSQEHTPKPDFAEFALEKGDRLLLCSDGLNNMLNHKTIEKIFGADTLLAKVNERLVKEANENGGVDNITVLSLEVLKNTTPKEDKPGSTGLWVVSIIALCCFFLWWFLGASMEGNTTPLKEKQKVAKTYQEEKVEKPLSEE